MNLKARSIRIALFAATLAVTSGPAFADRKASDEYVRDGRQLLEKGDVRAAVIKLKNAVSEDTTNLEARLALGLAQLKAGDMLSAEKELGIFVERADNDSAGVLAYGEALLQLRRFQDVLDKVTPKNRSKEIEAEIAAMRGTALSMMNDQTGADRAFRDSLALAPTARGYLGLARALLRSGKPADAEAEVDKALAIDPKSSEALLAKADLRRVAGKLDEALALASKAIEANPDNLGARLTRAGLFIQSNDDEKAAVDADAVLAKVKGSPLAIYYKALIATRKKDLDAADQLLQGLPPAFVNDYLPALYLSGTIAYSRNNIDLAEGRLRVYVNSVPDSVPARKILGAIYLRKNDAAKAYAALEPALTRAPDDAQLLSLAGTAAQRLGKSDLAAQYFERASERLPDDPRLQTRAALSQLRSGQVEKAIEGLEQAIDRDPSLTQASATLLAIHVRRGDFEKALEEVKELRAKLPQSPLPDYYEGTVYAAQQNFPKAKAQFEAALKAQPDFSAARFALARLAIGEKKPEEAERHLQSAIASNPKDQRAFIYLAELQTSRGARDEAIASLEKARLADPKAVDSRLRLVDSYIAKKDGERALIVSRELVDITQSAPVALDALGRAQIAAGDRTSAVGTYRQMVARSPESGAALHRLAGALVANDDTPGALNTLLQAARTDPAYAPAQQDFVAFSVRSGGAEGGVKAARELTEVSPKSTVAPVLLAEAYLQAKRYKEAADGFRAIRMKSPSSNIVMREFAALDAGGRGAEGRALLEGWVKEKPDDQAVRVALAGVYLASNETAKAIDHYEAALAKSPNNIVALNNAAWALRDKDSAKALSYADRAVKIAPNAVEVLDTYGWILVGRGEHAKAVEPLRKAASSSKSPAVQFHLAAALSETSEKNEAKRILDEILAKDEAFEERAAAEALRKRLITTR